MQNLKLINARFLAGYKNQLDLGLEVGISGAAIGYYEKGKSKPTIYTILKLAKGLKISPTECFQLFLSDEELLTN